ncbi:methyl-accepting chemotaxis protein [Oceanobacillus senegalensis]|uniref:methyl-accepting chemotaxis protein n=1 Tax=Oceanobacillus senegalensis TaxID=1936063 RepID=UPI000A30B741|nr:methyl-accepting chemotaxis protein [Oceanobacillus senegalensis]
MKAYGCANITTGLLDTEDIGQKLSWTIDHKEIFEDHFIINLEGEILALDDNLKEQGFEVGDQFYIDEKAIQTLKEMKHSTYSGIYEFGGMKRISGYAPIFEDHDASKEIVAVSVIDFDAQIVTERTWNVVMDGILIGLIPLLFAATITLYLIRKKTKPISMLIERTRMIADGDITKQDIQVMSKDEVGDLARHVEEMSTNLRQVIRTIKESSDDLVENANETSTSMNEMRMALGHVSSNMEEVASSTQDGAVMTEEASSALVNLSNMIQLSSKKADTSVKSAEFTMETAEKGIQKVNEIVDQMHAIKSSSLDTKATIEKLNNA